VRGRLLVAGEGKNLRDLCVDSCLMAGEGAKLSGICVWMAADGWAAGEFRRDMCVDGC
jgi:hypothetical protein